MKDGKKYNRIVKVSDLIPPADFIPTLKKIKKANRYVKNVPLSRINELNLT